MNCLVCSGELGSQWGIRLLERDSCVDLMEITSFGCIFTLRIEEDFEDDCSSCTKQWKKAKKENAQNSEPGDTAYETGSLCGCDQERTGVGMGMEMQS